MEDSHRLPETLRKKSRVSGTRAQARIIQTEKGVVNALENVNFMSGILEDLTDTNIMLWTHPKNLAKCFHTTASGFDVIHDIDGKCGGIREVSLVTIKAENQYPPHVHNESDAFFIILEGEGTLLKGKGSKVSIRARDRVQVPRGAPHGFELTSGNLRFISIQSPPIRRADGTFDLHEII